MIGRGRTVDPTQAAMLDGLILKLMHAVLRATVDVQRSAHAVTLALGLPRECEPVVQAAVASLARCGFVTTHVTMHGGIMLTARGQELLAAFEGRHGAAAWLN